MEIVSTVNLENPSLGEALTVMEEEEQTKRDFYTIGDELNIRTTFADHESLFTFTTEDDKEFYATNHALASLCKLLNIPFSFWKRNPAGICLFPT